MDYPSSLKKNYFREVAEFHPHSSRKMVGREVLESFEEGWERSYCSDEYRVW